MSIAEVFRANLKRHREAAGLSQAELSRRLGHRASWICDLERGRDGRAPSLETVERLSDALGLWPEVLLRRPPQRKSKKSAKRS